jgi:hypothetical protein
VGLEGVHGVTTSGKNKISVKRGFDSRRQPSFERGIELKREVEGVEGVKKATVWPTAASRRAHHHKQQVGKKANKRRTNVQQVVKYIQQG